MSDFLDKEIKLKEMDINDSSHIGTTIDISLDPSEITIRYLIEKGLVKNIIDHQYDLSIRKCLLELMKGNKYYDVEGIFESAQIYSINRIFDLSYEKIVQLGLVNNEEENVNLNIFDGAKKLINIINLMILEDRQIENEFNEKWDTIRTKISELELNKVSVKKISDLIKQGKKVLQKHQKLYSLYRPFNDDTIEIQNFLIDELKFDKQCLKKKALTLNINFKNENLLLLHQYNSYLELYLIFLEEIEKIIKENKLKNLNEIFSIEYQILKDRFYKILNEPKNLTEGQKKKELTHFEFKGLEENLYKELYHNRVSKLENNINLKERKLRYSDFGKDEYGVSQKKKLEDEINELKENLALQKIDIEKEIKLLIINNRDYVKAYTYDVGFLFNLFSETFINYILGNVLIDKEVNLLEKIKRYSQKLEYVINEDDLTCDVSGIGLCCDSNVVIPKFYKGLKVVGIKDNAFRDCKELYSVSLPNTLKRIGRDAFVNCTELNRVYFDGEIKDWCAIDFDNYASNPGSNGVWYFIFNKEENDYIQMEFLKIPETIEVVKKYQFVGIEQLYTVDIPDSVTRIETKAFKGCKDIIKVNGLDKVGLTEDVFEDCEKINFK